jgi:hypothetical protein
MESGACVHGVYGKRFPIRREKLFVLSDSSVGPSISLLCIYVDALAHGPLPGLATIAGMVDSASNAAVLIFAQYRAVKHDDVVYRIRTTGESLYLLPRQAIGLLCPALASVVRTPDPIVCGSEHDVAFARIIKMESYHLAFGSIACYPRSTCVTRQPALVAACAHEHYVWVGRIYRDFTIERIIKVTDGRKGPATIAADSEVAP